MICPIGSNAKMTTSSVNAGLSRTAQIPFLNKKLNPIKMSLIPDEAMPNAYEVSLNSRESRMLCMADIAIQEAIGIPIELGEIPLFLALPETLPGCTPDVSNTFIEKLVDLSGAKIDLKNSRTFFTGRTGGIHAIDMAFRYMQATAADAVIIGGVDTYLEPYLLATLDAQNRLLMPEAPDGFVPSESASFVVLVSEAVATKHANAILGKIMMPGFSTEDGHRYSNKPYLGEGLSNAVSDALIYSNGIQIQQVYSSLNGESYGAKELGVALNRNSERLPNVTVNHPADCYGDIGAATVPGFLTLLSNNKQNKNTLICSSSDMQDRAAVCVVA